MIVRPTFSRLPLAVTCPASMVIPHVIDVGDEPAEDDEPTRGEQGTVAHRYLQRVSDLQKRDPELELDDVIEQAVAEAPEWARPLCRALNVDAMPHDLAAEVALAWDWEKRKGRVLGQGLNRQYPELGPTEIAGTTDLLGVRAGQVYIGDFKRTHTRLPRPGAYLQTLVAGLAAADVYQATSAELELIYLDDNGLPWPVRDVVDAWDLDVAAESIAKAMREAIRLEKEWQARQSVPLTIGAHCRFCPALKHCPGQTAMIRSLPANIAALADGPLSDDAIAQCYRQVQVMKDLLGRVEQEIYRHAAAHPIDMGDGFVLGEVEWKREELEGSAAMRQLATIVGEDVARATVKVTLTKDAARDAIAANVKRGEKVTTKAGTGVFDKYLAALRAQRAIKTKAGKSIRVYKRKDSP